MNRLSDRKSGMGGARPSATGSRADASSPQAVSTEGFDPARVRVTAADYNGRSWDGLPFSHVPTWLEGALRLGAVMIVEDDRDYALWAVETPSGTKVAEPGDNIVCLDGHLDVHKDSYLASGMSASGRDRETGHEAQPASPAGNAGDAQSEDPQ